MHKEWYGKWQHKIVELEDRLLNFYSNGLLMLD
jgi:hypothetical protein